MTLDLGLRGRNFVIVGGTTGMGFAGAEQLAGDGANLALLARDGDRAAQKAKLLSRQAPSAASSASASTPPPTAMG